jgi:hypothetical protein
MASVPNDLRIQEEALAGTCRTTATDPVALGGLTATILSLVAVFTAAHHIAAP